jgi:hypothetical protein
LIVGMLIGNAIIGWFAVFPVCTENLNPFIMVMKSAKDRMRVY